LSAPGWKIDGDVGIDMLLVVVENSERCKVDLNLRLAWVTGTAIRSSVAEMGCASARRLVDIDAQ
jgi:hypothetical protein